MTTSSTSAPITTNTDAGYQNWVNEVLTGLNAIGLTVVADTGSVNITNYNAVMTCNAQTATSVLTVNSISVGGNNICIGMQVVGAGIAAGTYITSFGTGTGGTGTYNLSTTPGTVAAESMTIQFKVPGATATMYAQAIYRFNDTLQSTSAIYIKIRFGSGNNATTTLMIGMQLGTGSNGSGTITGSTIPESAVAYGASNIANQGGANYASYFCYNATQGLAWMAFKVGGTVIGTPTAAAGFCIYRSVDNTGAPTADTVHLFCNNLNSITGTSNGGQVGFYDYNRAANVIGTAAPNGTANAWTTTVWGAVPFNNYSTVLSSTAQVFPVFQWKGNSTTPGIGITNAMALGAGTDWTATGTTGTLTIIGSTSLTYIAIACITGYAALTGFSYTPGFTSSTNCTLLVYQ